MEQTTLIIFIIYVPNSLLEEEVRGQSRYPHCAIQNKVE